MDNISRNPQFLLDGSADQYKLSDASFLIGAGTKTYDVYTAPKKDILGERSSHGGPARTNPDMGAYENPLGKTTYPAKVKSLTATAANQSVILAWTANSETNIAKYAVYQSKTSPFTPAKTDSIGETTTASFTSTGLQNGIAYHFKVKAINSSNQSGEYSDQASATPGYEGAGGWYVAIADSGGTSTNEGSKGSPFLYLLDAVTASSSGDTIYIGGGTHTYTSSSKWNISFDGSKMLVIKGEGTDKTFLDAQQQHRHFNFSANSGSTLLDTTFKIMDMTLKNGRPSDYDNGGSVSMSGYHANNYGNKGHSPLFQNVVFESNQTKHSSNTYHKSGGAVYSYRSTPFFRDVTFKYNFAARGGGAVWIENADTNKTVTFERTKFIGNYLDPPNEMSLYGGAVSFNNMGKVIFESSTFDSNYIKINGDCCTNEGGAIYANNFYDSLIVKNTQVPL